MKIKCIITDDEPIARKGLRGYIEKEDIVAALKAGAVAISTTDKNVWKM